MDRVRKFADSDLSEDEKEDIAWLVYQELLLSNMWTSFTDKVLLQVCKYALRECPVKYRLTGVLDMPPEGKAIVNILRSFGHIHVTHMTSQEELSQDNHVIEINCLPGLFPVDSKSPSTVAVHVDKNFRAIVDFFVVQALQGGCAVVDGPQGCGKSVPAWFAMSQLASVHGKIVLYYPSRSVDTADKSCFAVLVGSYVIQVFASSSAELIGVFADLMRRTTLHEKKLDLDLDCVFFDDFCHDQPVSSGFPMKDLAHQLHFTGQSEDFTNPIHFLGATTSMMHMGGCFDRDSEQSYRAEPWDLDNYITLARAVHSAGKTLSPERLLCLGFSEANASLGDIEAAIKAKYSLAGHSCRFMLDYTDDKVHNTLVSACESAEGCLSNRTESATHIKNTLMVKRKGMQVPVSEVAYDLILQYGLRNDLPQMLVHMTEAVKHDNMSELGWLFVREVMCGLYNGCEPLGADKSVIKLIRKKWSFSDNLAMLNISPHFDLRSVDESGVTFSAGGAIAMFEDWEDLVRILNEFPWQEQGSLWVIPKYCRHPFFDFARVRRVSSVWQRAVVMDSFAISVANTHDCNAMVVQLLSDGLSKLEPPIQLTGVSHYAVLPTKDRAEGFKFKTGENMCKSEAVMRCETTVTRNVNRKLSDVHAAIHNADQSVLLAVKNRFQQEDVQYSAQDMAAAQRAIHDNVFQWTTVTVCGASFLQESLCGKAIKTRSEMGGVYE